MPRCEHYAQTTIRDVPAGGDWVYRVPEDRRYLGASTDVSRLRESRVLRLIEEPTRARTLRNDGPHVDS